MTDACFFDSSALAKRYRSREKGASYISSLCDTRDTGTLLYIADLARVEVVSLLSRSGHHDHLNEHYVNAQVALFLRHIEQSSEQKRFTDRVYQVIPWSDPILDQARLIARKYRTDIPHPLRALDAIQLASCLNARKAATALAMPMTLLCSDQHLLDLARAEGLTVVNPELVPWPAP